MISKCMVEAKSFAWKLPRKTILVTLDVPGHPRLKI